MIELATTPGASEMPASVLRNSFRGFIWSRLVGTLGTTIIVSAAMSDDIAYTMTKTINDNADRLRGLHASLADYDPSRGWLDLGVALHPGAERFYREKGWLK